MGTKQIIPVIRLSDVIYITCKFSPILFIFLAGISIDSNAQGIRDSVFHISGVDVIAKEQFLKEQAGLKSVEIDTLVLRSQALLDLSDLLARNTHIQIKDYGRGALSTASFRGTAPSHTQVSWNGLNINSPMLGMVDFNLVPACLIDGLSIQYGAASIASESGGLGGAIQLVSKADWQQRFGLSFQQEFASFGTQYSYLRFNAGDNKFQSKSRLYYNHSDNNYFFENKNIVQWNPDQKDWYHPVQRLENASYGKKGLSQEFFFQPAEGWIISNLSWFQDAERSVPTVLSNETSSSQVQSVNRQNDQTFKNLTKLQYFGENFRIKAFSGIDLQFLDYILKQEIPGLGERQSVNTHSKMLGWHNTLEYRQEISDRFSFETSLHFRHFDIHTLDSVTASGYDTTRNETSIFTGLYYQVNERLQLLTQFRKEIIRNYSTPMVYVAGATFRLIEDDADALFARVNLARNYHLPSLNDMYWQPGGNPNLLPEDGKSAEFSLQYTKKGKQLYVGSMLTGYYSGIRNWILWLPGFKGYWEPFNIDEVRSYGLELNANMSYALGDVRLKAIANLAWTETRELRDPAAHTGETSVQLPFIPRLSGNLFFSAEYRGFRLGYRNTSTGRRNILSSNLNGLEDDSEAIIGVGQSGNLQVLYPHYLNYLSLGKQFNTAIGEVEVEVKIDNLFNEVYRNVLNRFMPGRSYLISLKYEIKENGK